MKKTAVIEIFFYFCLLFYSLIPSFHILWNEFSPSETAHIQHISEKFLWEEYLRPTIDPPDDL